MEAKLLASNDTRTFAAAGLAGAGPGSALLQQSQLPFALLPQSQQGQANGGGGGGGPAQPAPYRPDKLVRTDHRWAGGGRTPPATVVGGRQKHRGRGALGAVGARRGAACMPSCPCIRQQVDVRSRQPTRAVGSRIPRHLFNAVLPTWRPTLPHHPLSFPPRTHLTPSTAPRDTAWHPACIALCPPGRSGTLDTFVTSNAARAAAAAGNVARKRTAPGNGNAYGNGTQGGGPLPPSLLTASVLGLGLHGGRDSGGRASQREQEVGCRRRWGAGGQTGLGWAGLLKLQWWRPANMRWPWVKGWGWGLRETLR